MAFLGLVRYMGSPLTPLKKGGTRRVHPSGSSVALLGETPRPSGFAQRGSSLALLGETPRPQWLTSCSTWGDPKTLRVSQLLYLGRPQDRTDSPHPDTRTDSPVALLGEAPRPLRVRQLLYLGRPQDRTRIRALAHRIGCTSEL